MFETFTLEFVGTIIAALMTVMILSYLIGDNPLFRVATHLFIGVAAGYAGVVAWGSVIRPSLVSPVLENGLSGLLDYQVLIPLILVILLLFKLWPVSGGPWGRYHRNFDSPITGRDAVICNGRRAG
jgi:hypothetical protein